jgi:ribosomal protein L37E
MTNHEKDKGKEPKFVKMEDGLIFSSEGKILVGLPTEIETKVIGGGDFSLIKAGGSAGAEKYSKVKYDWQVISGSPLPQKEMETLKQTVTSMSGTYVASFNNVISSTNICKKCGVTILAKANFCSNCGFPQYAP